MDRLCLKTFTTVNFLLTFQMVMVKSFFGKISLYSFDRKLFQTNFLSRQRFLLFLSRKQSTFLSQSHTRVYIYIRDIQSNCNNILSCTFVTLHLAWLTVDWLHTQVALRSVPFLQKTCTLSSFFLKLYI